MIDAYVSFFRIFIPIFHSRCFCILRQQKLPTQFMQMPDPQKRRTLCQALIRHSYEPKRKHFSIVIELQATGTRVRTCRHVLENENEAERWCLIKAATSFCPQPHFQSFHRSSESKLSVSTQYSSALMQKLAFISKKYDWLQMQHVTGTISIICKAQPQESLDHNHHMQLTF